MSIYTVQVEHGKRRPDAKTPEHGPVTPPYLHHPSEVSHVKVRIDTHHPDGREKTDWEMDNEANHTAYDMAQGLHRDNDMVTKTKIIHLEASRSGTRFQHFVLPEDPHEAHRLLTSGIQRTAAPVNPPGTSDYDKNRFHDLVSKGGFTSHPWRDSPRKGFMVSFDAKQAPGQVHHVSTLTPDHIAAHRAAIKPHLLRKGVFQGGWHDTATGDVYLDTSVHHQSEHAARSFAAEHKQKAYYALHSGAEMYMNPHDDPQKHEDHEGWQAKYSHVGTDPHPAYAGYAHLYGRTASLVVEAEGRWPWYAGASDEEIDAHPAGAQIRERFGEHTSPKGTKYRLVDHGSSRFVSAHVMPSGRAAGTLSWFSGKHDPEDRTNTHGVIHKVFVSGPHRRKGLASAMLDHARAQHPEDSIAHSNALSDDGKAWSEKKAVRYEVGDPDEYSNPEYHVTQYEAKDKVHPSTFGLPIKGDDERPHESGQGWKQDRHTTPIPVTKTWGTQDYVYAPHVHNLAKVPGSHMEPIDAYAHPDGTYEVNDHHRTCAAHLRGDSHINAYLWHPASDDKTARRQTRDWSRWRPHERIFGPTKGQEDPRLFSADHRMLPEVRKHLMAKLTAFMDDHGWHDWMAWARMYLAGSEASDWYGNNDFDVLVGVDYDGFKAATGSTMHPEEITDEFNKAFRAGWNDEGWRPPFDPGVWHLTGYVNPNSYDIRKIKPYAAYDVGADTWAVKPVQVPKDWGPDKFPESTWRIAEHYADEIERISHLKPASVQQHYAEQLFDHIHTDRQRAFSDSGTGVFDVGNVAEKYLDQRPDHPLALLVEMKNQSKAEPTMEHTGSAPALPSGADVRRHAEEYARQGTYENYQDAGSAIHHGWAIPRRPVSDCADGEQGRGNCTEVSDGFQEHLAQHGIRAHPYEMHVGPLGSGCRPGGDCDDGDHAHTFNMVETRDEGTLAVDHTARQLHPGMGFPHVVPMDDHIREVRKAGAEGTTKEAHIDPTGGMTDEEHEAAWAPEQGSMDGYKQRGKREHIDEAFHTQRHLETMREEHDWMGYKGEERFDRANGYKRTNYVEFARTAAIPLQCTDCGEDYFTDGEKHGCTSKTASTYTYRHVVAQPKFGGKGYGEQAEHPSQESVYDEPGKGMHWGAHVFEHQYTHQGIPVAKLRYSIHPKSPGVIDILGLAVHPDHRRSGLATRLNDKMQDHAEKHGMVIDHGTATDEGHAFRQQYTKSENYKPHLHLPMMGPGGTTGEEFLPHMMDPHELAQGRKTAAAEWVHYYANIPNGWEHE